MKKFNEYITEKLKISQYRKYFKTANWDFVEDMRKFFRDNFKLVSKNGYRVYFPFTIDVKKSRIEPPQEIKDWLDWFGYHDVDYRKGIYREPFTNKEIKLGKLFQEKGRDDLLKIFSSDPKREIKDTEFYVVLCCHPYDLLGISTGRGWSTCLDLDDKKFGGHHIYHLKNWLRAGKGHSKVGYLPVYLIRKNDMNIEKPVSRMILKTDKFYRYRSFYFSPEIGKLIYGVNLKEFSNFVGDLIKQLNEISKNYYKKQK